MTRFNGANHPTRRALGEYGPLTLEQAREKAKSWARLIKAGKDPKIEEQRERQAELRKQRHTFGAVAEDYLKHHVTGQRTAEFTARTIRKELIAPLGAKPVTEVTREDVTTLLRSVKDRPAPSTTLRPPPSSCTTVHGGGKRRSVMARDYSRDGERTLRAARQGAVGQDLFHDGEIYFARWQLELLDKIVSKRRAVILVEPLNVRLACSGNRQAQLLCFLAELLQIMSERLSLKRFIRETGLSQKALERQL